MLRRFLLLLFVFGYCASPAISQEEGRPAGYIMAYELKGADAQKGTVVVRKGVELQPKLLMPLFDDDAVFIRDEASRVTLSLAKEGNLVVSGKLMRKDIAGEMTSGDDGFTIIEQIVAILTGKGEDDSFSVLVSKGGDDLKAPMAVRGRNYVLRDKAPLRISWTGGEGPFAVDVAGQASRQEKREIEIDTGKIEGNRFSVTVNDAGRRKLRIAFELRKALPKVPDKVAARESRGEVAAIWLAGQEGGAWRFEAARQLRALAQDTSTTELIAALEKGWLPRTR